MPNSGPHAKKLEDSGLLMSVEANKARIGFHARPAAVVGRADVCWQGRCVELWHRDQRATLKVAIGRLMEEHEPVKVAAQEAPKKAIGRSLTPLTRAAAPSTTSARTSR